MVLSTAAWPTISPTPRCAPLTGKSPTGRLARTLRTRRCCALGFGHDIGCQRRAYGHRHTARRHGRREDDDSWCDRGAGPGQGLPAVRLQRISDSRSVPEACPCKRQEDACKGAPFAPHMAGFAGGHLGGCAAGHSGALNAWLHSGRRPVGTH